MRGNMHAKGQHLAEGQLTFASLTELWTRYASGACIIWCRPRHKPAGATELCAVLGDNIKRPVLAEYGCLTLLLTLGGICGNSSLHDVTPISTYALHANFVAEFSAPFIAKNPVSQSSQLEPAHILSNLFSYWFGLFLGKAPDQEYSSLIILNK